jgi:hypothetical protein
MHYMMIVKAGANCEAGKTPSEDTVSAILNYTQELRKAGVLVELSRLHPSSKGARIKLSNDGRTVTDGPFTETKEVIGGYWIINTKSMEDAIEWAKRIPGAHGVGEGTEIEIRQFLELEYYIPGETTNASPGGRKESAQARAQKQSQ